MNLRNYLSSKMAKNKTEKKEIKETEKVKEESVEELKKQNEELICSLQRLQADFENYKNSSNSSRTGIVTAKKQKKPWGIYQRNRIDLCRIVFIIKRRGVKADKSRWKIWS